MYFAWITVQNLLHILFTCSNDIGILYFEVNSSSDFPRGNRVRRSASARGHNSISSKAFSIKYTRHNSENSNQRRAEINNFYNVPDEIKITTSVSSN